MSGSLFVLVQVWVSGALCGAGICLLVATWRDWRRRRRIESEESFRRSFGPWTPAECAAFGHCRECVLTDAPECCDCDEPLR